MGESVLFSLLYFLSLVAAFGVFAYARARADSLIAEAFSWYAFGRALWIAAFFMQSSGVSLSAKTLWESVQWLTGAFTLALPYFALEYVEYGTRRARALFGLALIPSLILAAGLVISPYRWVYLRPSLTPALSFEYQPAPLLNFYAFYENLLAFAGLAILFRAIVHPRRLHRLQIGLIMLGFFISSLGGMLAALQIQNISQFNLVPFFFSAGIVIAAWGLFRLRRFEVLPFARDKVFEAMVEPVVILDNQNQIVDINSSMLNLLGKTAVDVIGKPAKEVFDGFPIPIKKYLQTSYAAAEAAFEVKGKEAYYQMTVWPLFDSRKQMTGRIFISHDVTAYKELERELRRATMDLENRVRERTRELQEAYDVTLEGWARALELRDKETVGHTRRVTDTTLKIARRMGIYGEELNCIRRGAIMHDIGKMGVPDHILLKPGELTEEEREIMRQHPLLAYQLLSPISFLRKALDIPYCHHEKWDGSGYPRGLKGEEIPLAARIFAIADVWDAINSERPYKAAWTREKSMRYFIEQSGKHFDPRVLNVFLDMLDKGEI